MAISFDYNAHIRALLQRAQASQEAIGQDRDLSDEGRRKAVARHVDPLIGEARDSATSWLAQTKRAAEKASAAYDEARRQTAANVNHEARRLALETARIQADYASWKEVSSAIAEAVELRDEDQLHAWRVLEPRLLAKFDYRTGPQSDSSTGILSLVSQVKNAIQALEPGDLKEARQANQAAQEAAQEAAQTLSTLDFERSLRYQTPLFADIRSPRQTVVEGGPGQDRWVITSTGGVGAFGG